MYKRYTTKNIDRQDIETQWGQIIKDAYYPMDVYVSDANYFSAVIEIWDLDGCSISKLRSDGIAYVVSDGVAQTYGAEQSFLITAPLYGVLNFEHKGLQLKSTPGSFVVEHSNMPYEIRHLEENSLLIFKISRRMLENRVALPERFSWSVFDCTKGAGAIFMETIQSIVKNFDSIVDTQKVKLSNLLCDLLALALENNTEINMTNKSTVRLGHLMRVENYVRLNLSNPNLTPELIAKNCGISVSYIYKLFSEQNRSLCKWIRDLRLEMCKMDLENDKVKNSISSLAYKWGFTDQSHFSRSFKERYGVPPGRYKAKQHKL